MTIILSFNIGNEGKTPLADFVKTLSKILDSFGQPADVNFFYIEAAGSIELHIDFYEVK